MATLGSTKNKRKQIENKHVITSLTTLIIKEILSDLFTKRSQAVK